MNTRLFCASTIVAASLAMLSTFAVGCAAPAEESVAGGEAAATSRPAEPARTVTASTDPKFDLLPGLWEVSSIQSADQLDVTLYGTGGGDPAINGNQLWLSISTGTMSVATWDLGLNIRSVDKLEPKGPGAVRITGKQETISGDTGETISKPFEATIAYRLQGDEIQPKITITTGGASREATADTSPGADFMSHVYKVNTFENDEIHARVFEAMGGDPAMNGDHLFLALMQYPEVKMFELDINVATVKKVYAAGPGQLRIDVGADTLDQNGAVKQVAATYAVKFSTGNDGPGSTISVSKL